jgi:AcrR family transcriptional regulator
MRQGVAEAGEAVPDDPRWARSRAAILHAAATLLRQEGPSAVTHQRLAKQAGVARATVYRHWPRIEELLLQVMAAEGFPFFQHPTTPIRAWLRARLRELADDLAQPAVQATTLTLMHGALWDRDIAAQRDQLVGVLTERVAAALDVAHDAGEIPEPPDPADAVAVLVGPLLYRTALQAGAVSDALIENLVEQVMTGRAAS